MLKKIKVQAYTHTVKKIKNYGKDVGYFAAFDPLHQEILYDASIPEYELGNHLFHEVMESINWQNDLKLSHNKISTISIAMSCVLRENPEFTKLFFETR